MHLLWYSMNLFWSFWPVQIPTQVVEEGRTEKGVLRGTVTDSRGEPLFGAAVHLLGTNLGMLTDLNGEYQFTMPANEGFTVVYSCLECQPLYRPNLRLRPGMVVMADATLKSIYEADDDRAVLPFKTFK